jgi:hypothetical protein
MQFVRAPDENVFIPPFNLIEIFLLALPLEWWMDKRLYERINDVVMGVIYAPLLLVAAYFEKRAAANIRANRSRGDDDDDSVEEWEQMADQVDLEADGWSKLVTSVKSNVEEEPAVLEVRTLRDDVARLQEMIANLHGSNPMASGRASSSRADDTGDGESAK